LGENDEETQRIVYDQFEPMVYGGGLRKTSRSVQMLPNVWQTGRELGRLLDQKLIEKPEFVDLIHELADEGCEVLCKFCDQGICAKCQLEQATTEMRRVIADFLHTTDIEPHDDGHGLTTALRPGLFRAWQERSGDPDFQIAEWLTQGGPTGIVAYPSDVGVFEPVVDEERDDPLSTYQR